MHRGQTPQRFRLSVIRRAYDRAWQDPGCETDDCTVVLRYCPEAPIAVVRGEDRNVKVTELIDAFLADRLFQLESQQPPTTRSEADQRAAPQGRRWSSAGTCGIGQAIVDVARDGGRASSRSAGR